MFVGNQPRETVAQDQGESIHILQEMKGSTSTSYMKGKHSLSPKKRELEIEEPAKCGISTEDSLSRRKRRKAEGDTHEYKNNRVSVGNNVEDCDHQNIRFSGTRKSTRRCKKRVMKKATILSWLVDTGMLEEKVEIFSIQETKRKGRIKRDGIQCLCCNQVLSVAEFQVHGGRNCGKPYERILTVETEASLLSYMIEAWNDPKESESHKFNSIETKDNTSDIYDDACMICADGGDLMCCEKCNSTYHPPCIGMEDVPEDSWYCPYCVCKFCEKPADENDYLLKCPQCEKRYHWECHQVKEGRKMDLNTIPIAPFCERSCREVSDKLRKGMVGKICELDDGYTWSLLHQMDDEIDESGVYIEDSYWRAMCHSKLAVARRLMEECFEPIQDRHTGIKVIPSVAYNCGSNFRRIDFAGFYTAVLEKDEEIISVASLRIHGTKLAEMPFIATSEAYRCKGMCRKLMVAIESALCFLNVENLIIPSVPERVGNWIERYGFHRLDPLMKKHIMVHNTLMFHDSVRLQKLLLPQPSSTK